MSAAHISDAVQRRSKRYVELHAQLEREVRRPTLAAKSPKQVRKFAKSELHRLYGDTP